MLRKIGNKFYFYASKRIKDNSTPSGYRIVQEYLGVASSNRERAARKEHDEVMEERRNGIFQKATGNIAIDRYINDYINSSAFKKLNKRTQNMEKCAFRMFFDFLKSFNGSITKVMQLKPSVLKNYREWLVAEQSKGPEVTNRYLRVLIKLMRVYELDKPQKSNWAAAGHEIETEGRKDPFTWPEVFKLLQFADFFWYGVACVGMFCGLRRDEFRNLTIYDVEIKEWQEDVIEQVPVITKGQITYEQKITKVDRIGGKILIQGKKKSDKTGIVLTWKPKRSHEREFNIADWPALWLKEAILRAKAAGTPYIFNVDNAIMTPDYLTSWFKSHAAEQGVERAYPHRLRHTYGTGIGEVSGVNIVKQTMGHKKLSTSAGYMGSRESQSAMDSLQKSFLAHAKGKR